LAVNVRHLEIFRAVVKAGSVSAAARMLSVSQPAVTKTLRLLELELGLPLFQRLRGRLICTPDAETLMPAVEHLFGSVESVDQLATQIKGGMSGRIRIAAVGNLAMSLVAHAIREMRSDHPALHWEVHALPTKHVIEYVNTSQVDLGILDVPYPTVDLQVEELCEAELVCVMRRDHVLASQPRITPGLLRGHSVITFAHETLTGGSLREAFRSHDVPYNVAVISNSSTTACSIVSQEQNIVGLLDPFTLLSGAFPDVVQRPFRPRIEMRSRLIFPTGRPVSLLTANFIQRLRDVVPTGIRIAEKV
jgi:DNA-binding transcriptional LysR family regulator